MRSTAVVSPPRSIAHHCQWPSYLAPRLHYSREYSGVYPAISSVSTGSAPAKPSYRVRGISPMALTARRAVCGRCSLAHASAPVRHALNKLPAKLVAIPSSVRKTLRSQFHTLLYRARQRKGLRVFALGQRLRHFVDHVAHSAGNANGSVSGAGSRTKRRAGMRSSPTRRCP